MSNAVLAQAAVGNGGHSKSAIIAGVTMLFSVGVFAAAQLGVIPVGWSTGIVLVGTGIVLRLAWRVSSESASSAQRARLAKLMSNTGLTVAVLSAIAAVPRLTKTGGVGNLAVDLAAQLWTVAILLGAVGPARTLGWRALLGAFLLGFLGLVSLARFVGQRGDRGARREKSDCGGSLGASD